MVTQRVRKKHPQSVPNGQSLVEMALLLPILLVLIVGTLDFGRLFFTKIVITNAAREGAYYLATHPADYNAATGTAANTVLAAQAEANNSGIDQITVSILPLNASSVLITVETSVDGLLLLGFLGNSLSIAATQTGALLLSSSVEMMLQ